MITVTLNANGRRSTVLADEDKKISEFIAEQGLNPNVVPYLDGSPITNNQMDKTFAELGIEDTCIVSSVVKTNNAR